MSVWVRFLTAGLVVACVTTWARAQEVRLNEIRICHASQSDETHEFIELIGPPQTDLSLLSVLTIDGDYLSWGRVRHDGIWRLVDRTIPQDGFFVLGDEAVNPDWPIEAFVLENGTQTILLVADLPANVPDDIDVDNDGVADEGVQIGTILDSVAVGDADLYPPPGQIPDAVYYGAPVVGPIVRQGRWQVCPGVARYPDGADTNGRKDWQVLAFVPGQDPPEPGYAMASPGWANPLVNRGDLDLDADVDLTDYASLTGCFTGAGGPATPECEIADIEHDGDVDLADYATLQAGYTGTQP